MMFNVYFYFTLFKFVISDQDITDYNGHKYVSL